MTADAIQRRTAGLTPLQIGLVFTLMGSCSVLVQATLAGRVARLLGEYRMLLCAMVVQASGLLCLGVSTDLAGAIAPIADSTRLRTPLTPATQFPGNLGSRTPQLH